MKKAIPLVFIICYSITFTCSAQQTNLDSLYTVWQDPNQPDSNRVQAYNDYILNGYLSSKPDTAAKLAESLHAYAKKHKYPKASAKGYGLQGHANTIQGNYTLALEYHEKSLAIREKIGDKRDIASSLSSIGNTYYYLADYSRSLEYYEKALAIQEEISDTKGMLSSLNGIGNIYSNKADYPHALEYHEKCLAVAEKTGNTNGIAQALGNIGGIYGRLADYPRALKYFKRCLTIMKKLGNNNSIAVILGNIGSVYSLQKDYPRALEYHEKSLVIREEIGDKKGIATALSNIGIIYTSQTDYPRALECYKKSLAIQQEIGDKLGIVVSLYNIGALYQRQLKNALALSFCQKSLALAEEIGALEWQKKACECLYLTYRNMGNSGKALEYYEKMIVARDSIFNEANTKKLVQIDMQHQFDRKEAATKAEQDKKDALANADMRKQKLVRNGFMGGFALVLLFAGVFLKQRNRIGKEKLRSEELLHNILPEEVAEELKANGSAEAIQIDQVTVLFTDFKSFTAMSEKLTPKQLVQDLHECFSAFDNICEKYGIEKIKTIGDAFMAAGGLPIPNTTHAADVVKAAFEIRDFITESNARKLTGGLPIFEIRIGIHSGPVVAGIVGVKKFSYDIWGDTVNTANRMESSGSVGQVNVSQNTYELLKDNPEFSFESRGKIEAKGKGEMEMYFVSKA